MFRQIYILPNQKRPLEFFAEDGREIQQKNASNRRWPCGGSGGLPRMADVLFFLNQ